VVLTFLGGIIGILLGYVIALVGGGALGITAVLTPEAIALAAGVCAFIGIVFGYYPARRAAKLSPIEALRYQ
jgi:putative ABC transport system permease protein